MVALARERAIPTVSAPAVMVVIVVPVMAMAVAITTVSFVFSTAMICASPARRHGGTAARR